jgi:sulfite reductase alpha subunit-like flavoprotein
LAPEIDWAGLPINLDLAFSREQRDKVYVQHLMRKRGARLWRWLQDGAQPCVCEIAAEESELHADAAKGYV